jgi:hypothetical protein
MLLKLMILSLLEFTLAGIIPSDDCPIPTQEILDCGFAGITIDECLELGCCFNPTTLFTCYLKPVPKMPVGTITDPQGNPVNLDENGEPQEIPDMIPNDPLVPRIAAEPPNPTNIPETPTRNEASGNHVFGYIEYLMALGGYALIAQF